MTILLTIPPLLLITGLSGYGLNLSYNNITRLQQYERQSEKAAEWSNTAAERLHKTRTTQASGALTLGLSFLSAVALILRPGWSPTAYSGIFFVNVAALIAARIHVGRFWNESKQTRVPFVQKFNEAVQGSEAERNVLGLLAWVWPAAGAVDYLGAWGLLSILPVGFAFTSGLI